jgi:hypothetical protein
MTAEAPTRNEPAPDGAKPGAEIVTPSDRHAYDADGKAAAREAAPITIGGETFHRRRKNWKITRDLRALLRKQERAQVKSMRANKKIDALDVDADDAELDRLNGEIDAAQDNSDNAAFEIIALLLRNDDGASPPVEHLKEHLDVEDAGALAGTLSGGAEPDPTPTTPSS